VGVIVRRDDEHWMTVKGKGKGKDSGGWSFYGVMLWLGGGKIETQLSGGESGQD
jgi:hypothetical protein